MMAECSAPRTAARSWTAANSGLTDHDVQCLAIDPKSPATLYAGTYEGGVFRSTDSGATWTAVNTGLGSQRITALAINPLVSRHPVCRHL